VLTARRANDQDNTLGIWFAPGDPSYQRYQRVSAEFEGDRAVIVAFAVPDVFQPTAVDLVRTVTRAMERIDGLARVSSLAAVARYRSAGDAVIVDPLVPDEPHDAAHLAAARTEALANELLVGNLFSADGTTAAVVGWLRPGGTSAVEARIVRQLRAMLAGLGRPDVHFYLSGAPVVEATYSELATHDQNRLVPLTFAFVVLTLYVIFRQWTAAILATAIQCLVFVVVVGTYLARGHQMNEVFGMIGPILIAACIGVTVFLQSATGVPSWGLAATGLIAVGTALAARPVLDLIRRPLLAGFRLLAGPTGELAIKNITQNPRRAALTIAMLGVGLACVFWLWMVAHSPNSGCEGCPLRNRSNSSLVSS